MADIGKKGNNMNSGFKEVSIEEKQQNTQCSDEENTDEILLFLKLHVANHRPG